MSTKQEQPGLRSVHDYPLTAGLNPGKHIEIDKGQKRHQGGQGECQDGLRVGNIKQMIILLLVSYSFVHISKVIR